MGVRENFNVIQNTSGTIAAIGLEKIGKAAVGNLVTPAIWVLNAATTDNTPSAIDIGIYASGFVSAPAAIAVSTIKALSDDNINKKVNEIKLQHEAKYRSFIFPVQNYGHNAPFFVAQDIAGNGGTVWQGQNGQWVYITDARGLLVPDFKPNNFRQAMQPIFPFEQNKHNKFKFCSRTCRW